MVDRGKLGIDKDLSYLDPRIRAQPPSARLVMLPADYTPGYWDVICQGGKENYHHIGNRRFRICIDNNLETYIEATTKHEKSSVVTMIVDSVRDCTTTRTGGGFVRQDLLTLQWYEVGDKVGREKVGHALRDAIKLKKAKEAGQKVSPSTSSQQPKPSAKRRRTAVTSNAPDNQADDYSDTDKCSEPEAGEVSAVAKASSENPTEGQDGGVVCKKIASGDKKKKKKKARPRNKKEYQEVVNTSGLVEDDWELSLKESVKQFNEAEGFDENDEAVDVALDDAHNAPAASASCSSKSEWQPPAGSSREFMGRFFSESKQPRQEEPPEEKLQWNHPPYGASMLDDLYKHQMAAQAKTRGVQDRHGKESANIPVNHSTVAEDLLFQQLARVMQGTTTPASGSSMFPLQSTQHTGAPSQSASSSRQIDAWWAPGFR